jgi:hypothetical protein
MRALTVTVWSSAQAAAEATTADLLVEGLAADRGQQHDNAASGISFCTLKWRTRSLLFKNADGAVFFAFSPGPQSHFLQEGPLALVYPGEQVTRDSPRQSRTVSVP